MNGDVIPRRYRKWLRVVGRRDITVRSRKDHQRLAPGQFTPVRVGVGKMAQKRTVLAFILHQERQMRGPEFCPRLRSTCPSGWSEENRKRIGPHRLDEQAAIGDLVELRRIHRASTYETG